MPNSQSEEATVDTAQEPIDEKLRDFLKDSASTLNLVGWTFDSFYILDSFLRGNF